MNFIIRKESFAKLLITSGIKYGEVKQQTSKQLSKMLQVAGVLVGKEMDTNSQQSVRKVARKLDMSTPTVYRTLEMELQNLTNFIELKIYKIGCAFKKKKTSQDASEGCTY